MAKNYRHFLLAGLSGLLLALAYPGWDFDLGFLVWIGFIPLFYVLRSVALNHDRGLVQRSAFFWETFFVGMVTGLVYFLIIFRWFWSIYPLDTIGIQSKLVSFLIVILLYVISSAGMAVFWGFFGLVYSFQFTVFRKDKTLLIPQLLVPAAVFTLLEYARSYGFGLLWAGSGTLFGPHWTLGNLAYALANDGLALKLSSCIGIYGLCFVIVLANFFFFKILARKNLHDTGLPASFCNCKMMQAGTIVLIILLVTLGPKLLKQELSSPDESAGRRINFAVIQTNQPTRISLTPKETLSAFREQLDLLNRVAKERPESQLIVFPEASDFFKNLSLFLTGAQIPNYFANLFKEPRMIIAGARIIDADGRAYSRVFALDTQKDIIGFYDKRLLTPEGEFLSYPTKFIANLFSKTKISEFGNIREFGVGKKEVSTVNFRGQFSAAPLVCSELLSPGLVREATRGADIIVGMASYGIFHGSSVLVKQNLANAQFRAAESQKSLLAAVNMGLSYAIDSEGNTQFLTQNQTPQILTGSIALNSQKSWYNKVGDIPVLVGSLMLTIVFSLQLIVRNRKNKVLMSNEKYNLEERTAKFGENIIKLSHKIPKTPTNIPIISQLVRAGTSVGANYCEADCAESRKDFEHKIGICKKESKETRHWLRMLVATEPVLKDEARELWKEASELNLIFISIVKSVRLNKNKN